MTICYFGIYDPSFSRNRIYIHGLREIGVTVLECSDTSHGFLKYWRLWRKHRALGAYDALVVGYPGHLVVPLARLIARGPVIADLLGLLSDAEIHSHAHATGPIRRIKSAIIDWLAVRFADIVLLESEAQKKFLEEKFGLSEKLRVLYTGADNTIFYCEHRATEAVFTVVFRGRLTKESGIAHILEAAKLLKSEPGIRFRILGGGPLLRDAQALISREQLNNVEFIPKFFSESELREQMCSAALSLGQFEDNPRLSRTIPHKVFESFAMGIPYLSGNAPAIREVVREGETGFFVPLADPHALADAIVKLAEEPLLRARVATNAERAFIDRYSPQTLARVLVEIARNAKTSL